MKNTKRKGFNFFRSYFDVYNELESDSDKLDFINALLDRQFLGIKPENLKGMAKFAWISQVNSIDSQIKGYEDKTKTKLTPTDGGCIRVENTPTEQVQVKGKVQVEEQDVYFTQTQFIEWFNQCRKFINLESNIKKLSFIEKNAFKELKDTYTIEDFKKSFKNFSSDDYYKSNNLIFPIHFLKLENFTKYLNKTTKVELEAVKHWNQK